MAGQCLKITILQGLYARFFYRSEMGGEVRKQSKKTVSLANIFQNGKVQSGDVLISPFCHLQVDRVLNKGTLVYRQAQGQGPPAKPLSMIIMTEASQRNHFQHGVGIGFLTATV